ncbi:MAG: hypothetical protein DI539_05070 [Flavobacterium psychrophilum]|nr:MAG: hypothetical protein DI539_05070 [Flavobacterium psychrophilum]
MNLSGPIIIIEDDPDEAMLLKELIEFRTASHRVIVVPQSALAIKFLAECEKPFMILSGINLRGLNGFQLRDIILSDPLLARKCTPYIFYAAHSSEDMLERVSELQAGGYFHDINDYNQLGDRLSSIISYWEQCAV